MDPKEDKIKQIVSKSIKVSADRIANDDDLVEKHGMDSLARVEILTELEKAFDVIVDDAVMPQLRTVAQLLELVREHSLRG